jgi:hypothetical protein
MVPVSTGHMTMGTVGSEIGRIISVEPHVHWQGHIIQRGSWILNAARASKADRS